MKRFFEVFLMLALLFLITFQFSGCAIGKDGVHFGETRMNITAPIKLSDGTLLNASVSVSRPVFTTTNFGYNPVTGSIDFNVDTSSQLSGFITAMNNMALAMMSTYAKTQGIPSSTVQIPNPAVTTIPLNQAPTGSPAQP